MNQEPGSAEEIMDFCRTHYDVSFPLFQKVEVNGPGTPPLIATLNQARPGLLGSEKIKWNFTKFLVGRDGEVLERYAPKDTPESLARAVRKALDD
jgi:glutathione peroxidase